MTASVSAVATTSFIVAFIVLQIVSLAFMAALMWVFHNIHVKRIDLLQSLQSTKVIHRGLEYRIMCIVYLVSTIMITLLSTLVFLQ